MIPKRHPVLPATILLLAIFFSACGSDAPSPQPTPQYIVITATVPTVTAVHATNTPDPCAPENIEAEVFKAHNFMREFDDASTLAASRPREQLADAIAELQRIRRGAENQTVPGCLANLKSLQLAHMNTVINTLLAFLGGVDQQAVDDGIALARAQHDQYTIEIARVLGLTVVPAASLASPTPTPQP